MCQLLNHVDCLRPHELQPTRLLYSWNSPDKNSSLGSHSILQAFFPNQGSKLDLLHCRPILYSLSHKGSLLIHFHFFKSFFAFIGPPPTGSRTHRLLMCQKDSIQVRSGQFSHQVLSDSLRPQESQHARPPCPSPMPGVYSNPCPSSR